jgi:16S rRNA (cytosine967-C5)-methyltransferase
MQVFAHDAEPRRMADLPVRAARAGVTIRRSRPALARLAPFDAVLCDVPCSGSGTWRRDPEAKWRLTPERLRDLRAGRRRSSMPPRPSSRRVGRLVYMTCSLLRAENEDQIAAFLDRSPAWSLDPTQLDTPLTASDGFFTAELRHAG